MFFKRSGSGVLRELAGKAGCIAAGAKRRDGMRSEVGGWSGKDGRVDVGEWGGSFRKRMRERVKLLI